MYKIVRYFFKNDRRITIKKGLTLEEARVHCKDPETSSSTCVTAAKTIYTKENGEWFDGYSVI